MSANDPPGGPVDRIMDKIKRTISEVSSRPSTCSGA